MKATMDAAGRIVIPKRMREQLGLGPGTELDVSIDGSALRLQPNVGGGRSITETDGWPTLTAVANARIDDESVRELRDSLRR